MNQRLHRTRTRKRRQEGAALLLVLFVILMATTTAAYSLSSTQFEVRSAGSLHQAMRTKYVAEGATVAMLGLCQRLSTDGCSKSAAGELSSALRTSYALPTWGNTDQVYSLDDAEFTGDSFVSGSPVLANDSTVSGGGMAAPYSPSSLSVFERWDLTQNSAGQMVQKPESYRLVISTYGTLNFDSDANTATVEDVQGTNELRFAHQTISVTRAYINVLQ
jgi:hypothetical protein